VLECFKAGISDERARGRKVRRARASNMLELAVTARCIHGDNKFQRVWVNSDWWFMVILIPARNVSKGVMTVRGGRRSSCQFRSRLPSSAPRLAPSWFRIRRLSCSSPPLSSLSEPLGLPSPPPDSSLPVPCSLLLLPPCSEPVRSTPSPPTPSSLPPYERVLTGGFDTSCGPA
jgi:hypothetical protein